MSEFINTVDIIGDEALVDSIIYRSITEYKDNSIVSIGSFAFNECPNLTSVDLPVVSSIGIYAFAQCSSLKSVNLPVASSIGGNAFRVCTSLTIVDLPVVSSIEYSAFYYCQKLTALILRNAASVCKLGSSDAFFSTPIKSGGAGYIYVPSALVDSYKAATNWSKLASQFRALEDYTVDGTTTGELDPTKI